VEIPKGCVRTADVICIEHCDLLELKKDTVLAILDDAPKLYSALEAMAQERLKQDSQGAGAASAGDKSAYNPKERDDQGGYDDFPDDLGLFCLTVGLFCSSSRSLLYD